MTENDQERDASHLDVPDDEFTGVVDETAFAESVAAPEFADAWLSPEETGHELPPPEPKRHPGRPRKVVPLEPEAAVEKPRDASPVNANANPSANKELMNAPPPDGSDAWRRLEVDRVDAQAADSHEPIAFEPAFVPIAYIPETGEETVRQSGLAWSMGIVFFGSVAFMLFLGWLADLLLGSSPWGIVVGVVLGSIIGFIQFFRISSRIFTAKTPEHRPLLTREPDEKPPEF